MNKNIFIWVVAVLGLCVASAEADYFDNLTPFTSVPGGALKINARSNPSGDVCLSAIGRDKHLYLYNWDRDK